MMDLVGMTELADVGKLQFWRSACVDSLRRDEEVLGHVEFSCVKPIFLRGVWIKFTGSNILRSDDCRGDILERVDLLVAEEDHYLGGLHEVLFGFGEEDQNESATTDGGALLQLDAGTHKWNFAFKIPINAPFSYCDERVEVIYTLNLVLDCPQVPLTVSQISHTVVVGCLSESVSSQEMTFVDYPSGHSGTPQALSILGDSQSEIISIMPNLRLFQMLRSALGTNKPSETSMKLTVPNVDSRSSATFEFAHAQRVLRARCFLETNLFGKRIHVEASLFTCTNLRRDPSKPFQSVRSLIEYEKSESTKKKTTSSNKILNGGFSSCLWSSSVTFESPQKQNIVDFEVPIDIDPTVRKSCLHEWPHPTPIPHGSRNCIMNFTSEGPLYEYKVLLVVSVYREKRGKQRLLLPSCIAEIVVRPPTQVPAPVLHPLPRQRIRTVRGNSERDLHVNRVPPPLSSFENRRRNSFQTPRVMNPPLWRVESNRNSVTGHFSTYNPGFLRRPGFARRSDSLNHDACAISSEAVITSLIQDENSMSQQNIGRNETIQPDRGSRVPSTKPITPYATKSVPKVMAEAMSRGPAAVLQDRTNAQHRSVQITPTRFAPALEVGVGAVVVCDQDVYATETGTPICRGGATLFEASPVTAFVCSPQTTRFITREEGNALSTMPAESGEGNVLHDAQCRSISPISRLSARAASLVTEDVSRTLFDAYTYSPTPVVLTSSPHSLSVSSIRPIVLYM